MDFGRMKIGFKKNRVVCGMLCGIWGAVWYDGCSTVGATSRWLSSPYCTMRNSDEMTIGMMHPTLVYVFVVIAWMIDEISNRFCQRKIKYFKNFRGMTEFIFYFQNSIYLKYSRVRVKYCSEHAMSFHDFIYQN